MRVTQSMYYDNLYGANNSKLNKELFDVNKQIASGLKIQYASDDVRTFTETMRLDNELTTIAQVKKSTESGYKVSNQTDVTMNEFTDSMNRMRTLLVQAANGTNDETSLDAIVQELKGIEKNLMGLSNTSINGQYLFSGSAINTKPISEDGTYNGNDVAINAFVGSNNQQQYNLTGADLFLGEESTVKRTITSNVVNINLLEKYPAFHVDPSDSEGLTPSSTIRNLMGDTDAATVPSNEHYFYLRGTRSGGEAFKEKIVMSDSDSVEFLLSTIGDAYGNTGSIDVVNVTMNNAGQIVVEDKLKGSSKLDFHMVAAVDFSGAGTANVTDIDDLASGETNFDNVVTTPGLFVKEFVKSNLTSSAGGGVPADAVTLMQGAVYDRTEFTVSGSTLSSSVSQVQKGTNEFATNSTKLSEVADLSQNNLGTLDGTSFKFAGTDINGQDYNAVVDLKSTANGGSTFSVGGTSYNIYNMDAARTATDADSVTYQQLMDVMNMVITDNLPAGSPGTDIEYDNAISTATFSGNTFLSYDGKIEFKDIMSANTKATVSIYDSSSDGFTTNAAGDVTDASSVMTFNTNNSLTVRDPKTDFFKTIGDMIDAVENYSNYPDADSLGVRNLGIDNAISMMDDLQDHTIRMQSTVGAQSNTLSDAVERTSILEISTMSLRSSVIDTDLAESSLRLTQLTLNYEAMLSTVGRVSQLSLVNYL